MITRIRIQNFRSLLDVTVELDPVTVLIGRSGTGKSNFVQGVRFLRDTLRSRQILIPDQIGLPSFLHIDHLDKLLVFEVVFSISGLSDQEFDYRLSFDPEQHLFDERLDVNKQTIFHQAEGNWIVAPNVVPAPHPNSGIMLGAIPGLEESTFAYFALASGIGCYEFPGETLLRPAKPGVAGHPFQGPRPTPGLADRGEDYLVVSNQIFSDMNKVQNWKHISRSLRAVSRSVVSLTLNAPQLDRLDVGHQFNGRVMSLDVGQESEGFRRYLAHMLALYQTPSKQTLLFEHPEAGLHPGALDSLAEEFRDCPEDGRGQVILTTHSPQLLDRFPPESIRVVEIKNGATTIGPLAPEQQEALRSQLLLPGELLTVDPARLEGQLNEAPG